MLGSQEGRNQSLAAVGCWEHKLTRWSKSYRCKRAYKTHRCWNAGNSLGVYRPRGCKEVGTPVVECSLKSGKHSVLLEHTEVLEVTELWGVTEDI